MCAVARGNFSGNSRRGASPQDGSDESAATGKEIRAVYIDIAGKPLTQANSDARSFFADAVWPLLADNKLSQERAALLVELTEPHLGIRMNDKIAQLGNPTELLAGFSSRIRYITYRSLSVARSRLVLFSTSSANSSNP